MGVVSRGIKNAFRNLVRTFSIVLILGLSIGLALIMLIARGAVDGKIASVKSSVGNTISVSPAGMRGFEGGGEALTLDQLTSLENLEHVNFVVKMFNDRLTTADSNLVSAIDAGSLGKRFSEHSGQDIAPRGEMNIKTNGPDSQIIRTFTPPVTLLGTTAPSNLSSTQGGGTFTLKSGEIFDGAGSEKIALIGSTLAEKNKLSVGSTFTAYDNQVKVVGIFDSGNTFSNNLVIMPLATVQTLTNQSGNISNAVVNVDSVSNVDAVTTTVKDILGDKADVTNSAETTKNILAPLENIKSISTVSLLGSLIAGSVIILLTMMMIVRERRREIGVLKAIGANNLKVVGQFVVESLTLTVMGSIIGLVIGIYGSNPVTKLLVQSSSQTGGEARGVGGKMMMFATQGGDSIRSLQTNVGWDILLYGLGVALVIAIVGSALPALFISKVRPAEVMRAE